MKKILILSLILVITLKLSAQQYTDSISIGMDEYWWAGVITESHLFPLSVKSKYHFDFYANTAGNQGQPLLVSNKGRYIWNEQPFSFTFDNGKIIIKSELQNFKLGKAGSTLKDAYLFCSRNFFPPSGKIPAVELFSLPQFNTWIEFTYYQNQEGIMKYARGIVDSGFKPGVLMIDEGWFKTFGDYEFDPGRFPDPEAMMKELKDLGFKVMLWVVPYYSPNGVFWKEQFIRYEEKGDTIWIVNAENPDFPAVTEWWDGFSNVIDLSNPKGYAWFKKQLEYLVNKYGVDGFKFDGGDANHYSQECFLSKTQSYKRDITPNEHSELYVKLGLEYPFNEYRAAWKMGGQPIAMRLRDKNHTWEDLQKLIPGIINQGLMGYAFTCPDLIGGGEYLSFTRKETIDEELIVRAAECHALMPMMQFSIAPWRVLSKENLQICVKMAQLHVEMGDLILELTKKSAQTGEPIVRSMDYEFPGKGYEKINDQFMLGPDFLVAPVVEKGAITRKVVFPQGKWEGYDGSIVKGPSIKIVKAEIDDLPWFKKIVPKK